MTEITEEVLHETQYLRFVKIAQKPKTIVVEVLNRNSGASLGEIAWYAQWRQYTFSPKAFTTFNDQCLQDIRKVVQDQNALRVRGMA